METHTNLDPRGLLTEAYRIDGITEPDCRSIFFDWALGLPANVNAGEAVAVLHAQFAETAPDHPMTRVLAEGLAPRPPRGRRRRRAP